MSETTRPAPKPTLKPPSRRAAVLAVGLAGIVALGVAALVGLRREIARDAVSTWLQSQGVQAQIRLDALSPSHLKGALVIGPPAAPVLVAPDVDADFSIRWSFAHGFETRLSRIRLDRPRLHAWLGPKGLSFGQLDPLLSSLTARPAGPQGAPPDIQIRRGDLILTTAAGTAETAIDARLSKGRVASLAAELSRPAPLRFAGRSAGLETLSLQVKSLAGGDLGFDLETRAASAQAQGLDLARPTLRVQGVARLDQTFGAVRLTRPARVAAEVEAVRFEGVEIGGLRMRADLAAGQAASANGRWTWRLDGGLVAQAARAHAQGVEVSDLALGLTRLHAVGTGADETATGQMQIRVGQAAGPGWRARAIAGNAGVSVDAAQGSGRLQGGVEIRDAASTAADGEALEALGPLGRALRGFALAAPQLDLAWSRDGVRLSAGRPILAQAPGVSASLASRTGAPLLEARADGVRGGLVVSTSVEGGTAKLDLSDLRVAGGRLGAEVKAEANGLSVGPVRGGRFSLDGTLAGAAGGFSFSARRCLDLSADQVAFGPDVLTGVAGRICPTAAPLVQGAADGWRASGRAQEVRVTAPTLQLRAEAAEGPVEIGAKAKDLEIEAKLDRARVFDLADRFRPATASGSLALRSGTWRGDIGVSVKGERAAQMSLVDELASGRGTLSITSALTFRRGGLQPGDLTALAEGLIGSPVEGSFAFQGGFNWSRAGVGSSGRASVSNLSFRSPLGAAKGAGLILDFTSLAPLVSRPAQPFEAARIDSFVPLTGVKGRVQLLADRVRVEGAESAAAGGTVRLERTEVPFAARAAWTGALDLDEIRADELVKASPFADKVQFTARIGGRLPFVVGPQGVSFIKGHIEAAGPGRLSIPRALLTGGEVAAAGAPAQATPNAMQSMAYEALEDLAFSKLGAEVNSLPGGRLGVLFHVKGRHDPAHPRSLSLPLGAALRGQIADKPLPLPAGTEVDLTLDTSLNFDELEHDFTALRPPARP